MSFGIQCARAALPRSAARAISALAPIVALLFALCASASAQSTIGGPAAADQWGLLAVGDGFLAAIIHRDASGTEIDFGLGCVTRDADRVRINLAIFDDQLNAKAQEVTPLARIATMTALPGATDVKVPVLSVIPHYDQVKRQKSVIFAMAVDRDKVQNFRQGTTLKVRLDIPAQYSKLLSDGFELPLDNFSSTLENALGKCIS